MERVHPDGSISDEAQLAMTRIKMEARRDNFQKSAKLTIPAVLIVFLLIIIYYFVVIYEAPLKEAPEWEMAAVDSGMLYNSDDYYNEGLTIIEFFHTECGHCKEMAPVYSDIYANYTDNLTGMFSIGGYHMQTEGGVVTDSIESLRDFQYDHGSQWPYLFDKSRDLMTEYGANSYPSMYMIKDKKIVEGPIHHASYSYLAKLIEKHSE